MGVRYQQPQAGARIDAGHSIGRRVVYASLVANGCVDIVDARLPVAVSANRPTLTVSPLGLSGEFVPANSQYYSITTAPNLISGYPLTVACWARLDSITAGGVLYSLNGTGYSAILGLLNSAFLVNQASAASTNVVTASGADTGWHHIVCVHRSNTFSLYVDGVLRAQTAAVNYWGSPAAGNHSIGNRLNGSSPQYFDGAIQDLWVIQGDITEAEAKSLYRNHWQILKPTLNAAFLKAPAATGVALGVSAVAAPAVGSMAFKSQPAFALNATTAAVHGAMSFGPASRVAVNATTGDTVGSMAFKSQPVFGVAATTGQTLGSMAFASQPSLGVSAQTAPVVGSMAFGPSARLSVSATLAPAVGDMAFVAQPKFAVVAQTAPVVGSMAFGPSSRLTVTGQTAPAFSTMAFKSQPVLTVATQTAPAVSSMAFATRPRFDVAGNTAPTVGAMTFLSGAVADVPGELCLAARPLGSISGNIRKRWAISFEVRPL